MWKIGYKCFLALNVPLPRALRDYKAIHRQLGKAYKDAMQSYLGRVALFRATAHRLGSDPDPTLGWGKLVAGKLEVHEVPGDHSTLIREPHVQVLAQKLTNCLNGKQAQNK